jgi:polysaccharide biosynthesis protein PslH
MRIAFITSRFPLPTEKGDKLRAFQHLKWLSSRHDVYLFALSHHPVDQRDIDALQGICAGVSVYHISTVRMLWNLITGWLHGMPAQVAYFFDKSIKLRMQEDIIRLQPGHLFVQPVRSAEYVRALPIPKTLD